VPSVHCAGIEVLDVEIRWPDPIALARLFEPVMRSVHGHERELAKPLG